MTEVTARERTRAIVKSMEAEEQTMFLSRLRILRDIEYQDLVEAGAIAHGDLSEWDEFLADPYDWALSRDVATYARLWGAMMKREMN